MPGREKLNQPLQHCDEVDKILELNEIVQANELDHFGILNRKVITTLLRHEPRLVEPRLYEIM